MNEIEVDGKKLKIVTTILHHRSYDEVKFQYDWHKNFVSNPRIYWNLEKLPPQFENMIDNEHIFPINVQDGRKAIDKIFSNSIIYFQTDDPDYYIFFGWDAFIIRKDFEIKSIEYMEKHRIMALFPFLDSKWSAPKHPFVQPMQDLVAKYWALVEGIIFHKKALKYYYESMFHPPFFWHEIRMPTILAQAGFHITANPFLDERFFKHIKDKSLTEKQIKEAIKIESGAIHPVKDYKLLDLVKR